MPLGLRAIPIKELRLIDARQAVVNTQLLHTRYGQELQRRMQKYPTQQPTKYRRTGDLGRGWIAPGALKATAQELVLVNRVDHARYVQGPWPQSGRPVGGRQTIVMRRKGWQSISDVAREVKRDYPELVNQAIRARPPRR